MHQEHGNGVFGKVLGTLNAFSIAIAFMACYDGTNQIEQ